MLSILASTVAVGADMTPAADAAKPFQWSQFLGPFHMVLLHFPIGFVAAAVAFEAMAWFRPSHRFQLASRTLLWFTLVSGAAAAAAGLMRAEDGGFDQAAMLEHRNHAFGFLAVTLLATFASHAAHRPNAGKIVPVHRVLLIGAFLMVGSAGHHGGNLTHGTDFLTQGAPQWVIKILKPRNVTSTTLSTSTPSATPGEPGKPGTGYSSRIRPLFENRCYSCHGPEKHKGDFRLDVREKALAGGESGSPGIVPGDPMKSQVVRLILLPRDHDDAMPPEGKQQLSPEEILAVVHWIQAGAPFEGD